MSSPTKRFQDIQLLRAVACLMVLFQHVSLTATLFSGLPGAPTMPFYLGVELFFVISGYVVTRSLFSRVANPLAFLTRRFFRLTPAIVTFLIFSLIVFTMIAALSDQGSAQSLNMTGAAVFLMQAVAVLSGILINYFNQPLYYFGAMWSLSVEYQFYAAYAAAVGMLMIAGLAKQQIKDWLLVIFAGLLVLCYATRIGILSWPILELPMSAPLKYIVDWRFDFLLLGAVLAFLTDRYGALQLPPRGITVLIGLATLALTLVVGMAAESSLSAVKPIHDRVLMPVSGLCFTLLVALASGRSAGSAKQIGTYHVLVWLGDRSYSMYLFHFPVMALVWWGIVTLTPSLFYVGPIWYGLVQATLTFAMTIFLADLTYRYVELPWNGVGERISDRIIGRDAPEAQVAASRMKPAQPNV
jgi:peptidoglycan/LPS O-acetylase OafA/YrhL